MTVYGQTLNRYKRARELLKNYNSSVNRKSIIDYAFQILSNVSSHKGGTKLSVVYDIRNLKIYYRTIKHKEIKIVNLGYFDFNSSSPVLAIDINA
jgi:hypothetical protein